MTERVFVGDRSLAEAALATVERMKARLVTPEAWTQGGRARNSSGAITSPYKEDAVCWCLLGALDVEVVRCNEVGEVTISDPNMLSDLVYLELRVSVGVIPSGVAEWNDRYGRKHGEVLEALDRAKARFEKIVADYETIETT